MNLITIIRMIMNAFAKPKQHILIQETPSGTVIDIGGGGRGVIAQAGGAGVVAVDRLESEIRGARDKAPGTQWMVADATELPCKENSFENATAFFSCMYMTDNVKEDVFRETQRVLKKGGEFWIWDARIVPRSNVFAIRLQVHLGNDHTIGTLYGVRARDQSAASIGSLLRETGFAIKAVTDQQHWFLIKAERV